MSPITLAWWQLLLLAWGLAAGGWLLGAAWTALCAHAGRRDSEANPCGCPPAGICRRSERPPQAALIVVHAEGLHDITDAYANAARRWH